MVLFFLLTDQKEYKTQLKGIETQIHRLHELVYDIRGVQDFFLNKL